MTTLDGRIIGKKLLVDNGKASRRWTLVILGDGYSEGELGTYATNAQNFISTLKRTRPYDDCWNAINIHRIDVASTDSGADDPVACGGTGATARTFFP